MSQLAADNVHISGRLDPDRHPIARHAIHDEANLVANQYFFASFSAENEHAVPP
jgi:hypothetical protein